MTRPRAAGSSPPVWRTYPVSSRRRPSGAAVLPSRLRCTPTPSERAGAERDWPAHSASVYTAESKRRPLGRRGEEADSRAGRAALYMETAGPDDTAPRRRTESTPPPCLDPLRECRREQSAWVRVYGCLGCLAIRLSDCLDILFYLLCGCLAVWLYSYIIVWFTFCRYTCIYLFVCLRLWSLSVFKDK